MNPFTNFSLLAFALLCSLTSAYAETPERHSLTPCPDKPNCVNSQAPDDDHSVDPWPLDEGMDIETTRNRLVKIIDSLDRAKVVSLEERYVHAEFTSSIFSFTDDVEFLIDANEKVVHVRSASRKGYFDFGANRKRIKKLRTAFEAQES